MIFGIFATTELFTPLAYATTAFQISKPIKISIDGINDELKQNVILRLEANAQMLPNQPTYQDILDFYKDSTKEITKALQPYGYFKPQIKSTLKHLQHYWQISYYITPGPRVIISSLDLTITGPGKLTKPFQHFIRKFPLKTGSPLNSKKFNNAIQHLLEISSHFGYFEAQITKQKLAINTENNTATLKLHFNTGPRYRFGQVTFSKTHFSNNFLKRFIPFKTGQPYNQNKIQLLQQNLSGPEYFQQVIVTPYTKPQASHIVPIKVILIERKSRQYNIGFGYGTDTGFRGIVGVNLIRLNSYGHNLDTVFRTSRYNNDLMINYMIPGHQPAINYWTISTGVTSQNQPDIGTSQGEKIGVSYSTRVFGWLQTMSLTLLQENYNLIDYQGPAIDSEMFMPGIEWQRLRSNSLLRPSKGYNISIHLIGASKKLISKDNFFQSFLSIKNLIPITHNIRLFLQGSIGYTKINNIKNLPLSLQLLAGGSSSIRGYGYNSIGPGKGIFTASVELQHRLKGNWFITGFYDSGNVSDQLFDNIKSGAGPGILWQSPIGSIALTIAKQLDNHKNKWMVQFSMGPQL